MPEPTAQSLPAESGASTVISFVRRGDSCRPDEVEKVLTVDHGDPNSVIQRQVGEFLRQGMRTCDRRNKYIPEMDCYRVATLPENHDTLFLVPDAGRQRETMDQGSQALNVFQEVPPELGRENVATEGQEDDDLLVKEMENATNAQILDKGTTIIYFKKRIGASNDALKPAETLTWEDVINLEVPPGDPGDIVSKRAEMFGKFRNLQPYDGNLRRLAYADCYRAAIADKEHNLYLIEEASRRWKAPEPLPLDAFIPRGDHSRIVARASLQAQQATGFESSEFAPLLDVSPLPSQQEVGQSRPQQLRWTNSFPHPDTSQPPLVKSTPELHRDKIGAGGKSKARINRVGLSFEEESVKLRKRPANMRARETGKRTTAGENEPKKLRSQKTTPERETEHRDSSDGIT